MKRPQLKGPDLTRLRAKLSKLKGQKLSAPKLSVPKLKRPALKRPSAAKAPSVKRPRLKGPDVNLPKPLSDLYSDLRERHLLVVVVALIAAIIAVPLLVRSGAETAPPPAPIVDVEQGLPLDPAVVASNPGLRDFHERLDGMRARNPFKQQLVPSDRQVESSNLTREDDGTDATDDGASTGTGTDPGAGTGASPDTDMGTGSPGSDDDGSGDGGGSEEPKEMILEPRIDVKVGRTGGATKVKEGVEMLALLPDDKNPVLQYAGSDRKGKGASFVVSSDVVSVSGEGVCKPRPADCRFLHLKVGQRKRLTVSSGATFSIKLLKVTIERVPARASGAAERTAEQEGLTGEGAKAAKRSSPKTPERNAGAKAAPSPGLVAELAG